MKTIYFDMDGTIADLYNCDNWLEDILTEKPTPYIEAKPMVSMTELKINLRKLRRKGYKLGVISWLAKDSSEHYQKIVAEAKINWLNSHINLDFDEIHIIPYGSPKHEIAQDKSGVIFDDDVRVRRDWLGNALDPQEHNIIKILEELIKVR